MAERAAARKALYVERNPESRREAVRLYEARNAEDVANRKRAWFDKNPGYLRSYYARNRKVYLVKQASRRATSLGVPFGITVDDIEIPDVCPVLGIEIRIDARGGFNPSSPSLDRVIPELGYVPGNVRVISNRANLLKRDATLAELEALVAYVRRETRPEDIGLGGLLSEAA